MCIYIYIYIYPFILLNAKELGREAYIDEVFYQTHLYKGFDQFVYARSRRTHVKKTFTINSFKLKYHTLFN